MAISFTMLASGLNSLKLNWNRKISLRFNNEDELKITSARYTLHDGITNKLNDFSEK